MFADYHVHTEFSNDSVYPMEQVQYFTDYKEVAGNG